MPTRPDVTSAVSSLQNEAQKSYISFAGSKEGAFLRRYPGAFSAVDIYPIIKFPGNRLRAIGSVAAISISTHRDVFPVSSMPYVSPRGFTQGHRTTAGTIIFHTIDRNALSYRNVPPHQHADELPLFDVLITYVNEAGMLSYEEVVGLRILDFGKTLSLENLNPVESYSYMALDYKPLRAIISGDERERSFMLKRSLNRNLKPVAIEGRNKFTVDPIDSHLQQPINASASWEGELFGDRADPGTFYDTAVDQSEEVLLNMDST